MQYQFTIPSDGKVIELGGGSSPIIRPHCMGGAEGHINVDFRVCHTPSGERTVDFSCDLNVTPWTAIGSNEFDCAISRFCLEHVSYVQTLNFLLEVFRILRQGGKAAIIVPNTEEQLKWIQTNPNGWDGKNLFESASCILFGDQQHSAREGDQNVQSIDSHKAYFSPQILTELLQQAGFEKIVISSFGDRRTDLIAECIKPVLVEVSSKAAVPKSEVKEELAEFSCFPMSTFEERQKVFSRQYFDGGYPNNTGGYGHGGYSDFPIHEVTVRHILARKPESVLELGCARGYILKKLEDKGIRVAGIDISDHCHLLRVCDKTVVHDICRNSTWDKYIPGYYGNMGRLETINDQEFDLCVSVSLLEHIPEECVPTVVAEMSRTCKRGLHGVDFGRNPSRKDKTKCTLKPKEWWLERLPKGHEVVEKDELESGSLPP
jgi:ubiquinone/menaquinone biosynthesis C-methylase UbiE